MALGYKNLVWLNNFIDHEYMYFKRAAQNIYLCTKERASVLIFVSSATACATRSHTLLHATGRSACAPYVIDPTPSANRATGSRSHQSKEPLRQANDCRPQFVRDRRPCQERRNRFAPISDRSVTFESSWPVREMDKM